MAKNKPVILNFEDHLNGDLFMSFCFPLKHKSGALIDLTGCSAKMQFKKPKLKFMGPVLMEFSSDATEENNKLHIRIDQAKIEHEGINSWRVEPGIYSYELQVTDLLVRTKTYVKGKLTVIQDLTI